MKNLKFNMNINDIIMFISSIFCSIVMLIIDLLSKNVIISKIEWGSEITVIDGFFSISHVHNTGAAWGIFSDKTFILSITTCIAALVIIYLIYAATVNKTVLICLSVILGGAVGNLSERIFRGYVTDFLSFNIFGYNFPSFNFADICITCGCFVLLFYIIFFHKKDKRIFRDGTIAAKIWGD